MNQKSFAKLAKVKKSLCATLHHTHENNYLLYLNISERNSLVAFAQEDTLEGEDLDDDDIDATVETDDDAVEDEGVMMDVGEDDVSVNTN